MIRARRWRKRIRKKRKGMNSKNEGRGREREGGKQDGRSLSNSQSISSSERC